MAARGAHAAARLGKPLPAARVLVNRRIDVALAAGADGVHLGFDALAVEDARELLPATAWIGRSLHSVSEIEQETAQTARSPRGIDYAHLAPIWDPLSKPATRPSLGPAALRAACAHGLPVIAQGGLDPERARVAIDAGAAGIAVTGSVTRAKDPERTIRALRDALDGASRGVSSRASLRGPTSAERQRDRSGTLRG